MTEKVDSRQLLLWECNRKHRPTYRTKDAPNFMGVAEQTSHGGSNNPTFSPITQLVPEIWPKTWSEYVCCYGNVMKIYNHTNRIRDAPEFMDDPDQPSHGHSKEAPFSQITQALPET